MQDWDERIDVMITSPIFIDMEMFYFWVDGLTIQEASSCLQKQGMSALFGVSTGMLQADVKNHFVQFQLLEPAMHRPPAFLGESSLHQIEQVTKLEMLHKYYELDELVIRELLGKKLSSRDRRHDCEEVSEKANVALRSCRRQFDNLRRVFKCVEDMPGSLVENIKTCYCLAESLAQQYAAIVFISNNKFDLSKKKLTYLTFGDFAFCANQLMSHWSYRSKSPVDPGDMDVDLDSSFFQDLKELKILTDKKDTLDDHKNSVYARIRNRVSEKVLLDVESNFRNYSKSLVSIAGGLNHARDVRDLFVDIVDKLIELFRHAEWTESEVEMFLIAHREMVSDLQIISKQPHLIKLWDRFMIPLTRCIKKMYHA